MKIILVTLIAVLSSICQNTFADEPPPPTDEKITVSATLKADPVQEIQIGSMSAKFEKTTLGEILKTVGVGSIEHAGDAGGSQYWLCYSLPNQRVWFISHGEMGWLRSCLNTSSSNIDKVIVRKQNLSYSSQSVPIYFYEIRMDWFDQRSTS